MIFRHAASALAILAAAGLVGGCAQIRGRQGYVIDNALVDSVQPGVDNMESVRGTLGQPTFVGQFDDKDWYYVTRETRRLGYNLPRPVGSVIFHVRFDEAGNVAAVNKQIGTEQIASIDPSDRETPTVGADNSFLEELFGNIGTIGGAPVGGPQR
jgi:outer membrane protein assembly factor BamE (lipoprotein component of BamABCDE complex)